MLIEANCWEAVAAGCTELFPAAPIVSRRLNPSKCLCALAAWSEGRGPRSEQGQPSPGCLHFPSLLLTHPPTHHLFTHLPIRLLIHPSTHPSSQASVVIIQSLIPSAFIFDIPRARHHAGPRDPGSQSRGGEKAPRACDGGEHAHHRSTGWLWEMIRARAVSWGPSREFTSGTWADALLDRAPAWTRAQRQEEGQQGAGSHL